MSVCNVAPDLGSPLQRLIDRFLSLALYRRHVRTEKLSPLYHCRKGLPPEQFSEVYYWKDGGKLEPVIIYYPEYYQTMCSRLYNFGGKEVIPSDSTIVISYIQRDGYKEIESSRKFQTYEAAVKDLKSQTSGNYLIVGNDPFESPVPLEKLEHYHMVHHSESWEAKRGDEVLAYYVEIFEYQL